MKNNHAFELNQNPHNLKEGDWVIYKDKVGKIVGRVNSNICEFWVLWSGIDVPHSAIASTLSKVNVNQDFTGHRVNGGYCKRLLFHQGEVVAEVHFDGGQCKLWNLSHLKSQLVTVNVYTNSNLINIPLDQIIVDKRLQARASMSKATVHDYTHKLREGVKFPPIILFQVGADYYLVDGFHRVKSAQRANLTTIPAIVHHGTLRDAILFSLSVNTDHGLSRTNADKRKVVLTLLNDPQWSKLSLRELSAIAQVSHAYIGKVKKQLAQPPMKKNTNLPPDVIKKGKDCFLIDCGKDTVDLLIAFMKAEDIMTAEGAIDRLLLNYNHTN